MAFAEGVDYSFDRPSLSALKSAGKAFCMRYHGAGTSNKWITKTEAAAIHAMGLAVVALCEGAEGDALNGYAQGQAHARAADAGWFSVGLPNDRPIYFAVDFDMQVSQRPAVAAYLNGCASVIGANRVGVYGGIKCVDWAYQNRLAAWFFQTYAWSGGAWAAHTHVQQYSNNHIIGGGAVDYDRAMVADYGQWPNAVAAAGAAVGSVAPIVTAGPWDYTGVLAGITSDLQGAAGVLSGQAGFINALRG